MNEHADPPVRKLTYPRHARRTPGKFVEFGMMIA
jgi:hypothetical protein